MVRPILALVVATTQGALPRAVAKAKETPGFGVLRKQRQAVERAFSRLKGQRSLNHITVRGKWKVTAHCYLALIAMQAKIVLRSGSGNLNRGISGIAA